MANEVTSELLKEVHGAVDELRKMYESKGQQDALDKAKLEKLEKTFADYDEKNEKLVQQLVSANHKQQQIEENLNALIEYMGSVKGINSGSYKESLEYKTFMELIKTNEKDFHPTNEQKQLLRTDSQTNGGYLVPVFIESEILKNITETSPMRSFARVTVMTTKTAEIARRIKNVRANYEGEAVAGGSSVQEYAKETITVHRMTQTVPFTQEMLLGFGNIEQEIVSDIGDAFAQAEALNFVSGDGVKKPQGFTVDNRIEIIDTAASNLLVLKDLINISGELKSGYNPMYFMNRRTLARLRGEQALTTGEFIWTPGGSASAPATINGYMYSSGFIDMDSWDDGVGAKPVAFGDLRSAYRIYDRTGTTMIRDQYSKKDQAIIEYTFHKYNDGRVVKPEAIKLLRLAA